MKDPLRHRRAAERHPAEDLFGHWAEQVAVFMGTPAFLIGQVIVTLIWIMLNVLILRSHIFDPYPFILLNLAYSIQAGFAAPFILCAQTRQAKRDREAAEADALHREELASHTHSMLITILTRLDPKE